VLELGLELRLVFGLGPGLVLGLEFALLLFCWFGRWVAESVVYKKIIWILTTFRVRLQG
jgi:hypothetical protein